MKYLKRGHTNELKNVETCHRLIGISTEQHKSKMFANLSTCAKLRFEAITYL